MLNQKVLDMTLGHNSHRKVKRQQTHKVHKLEHAAWVKGRMPKPLTKDLTASQKRGKAFERKALRYIREQAFPNLIILDETNEWIEFRDATGCHIAQPDGLNLDPKVLYLFECKLTQNDVANHQMSQTYSPLLRHIYNPRVIVQIQVCKNLQYKIPRMITMDDLCNKTIKKPGPWLLHLPLL